MALLSTSACDLTVVGMSDKILAIATSAGPILKSGKTTGLWLSELTHFLAIVQDAGFDFDIASPQGGKIPLDEGAVVPSELAEPANARFLKDPRFVASLDNSLACADVDPSAYIAVYLAGGHGTMFDFRQSRELQRILTAMYGAGRFVTGVCHGVSGFVDAVDSSGARIVAGKRVTGFSNLEDHLMGVTKQLPFLLEDALKANGAEYHKNLLPFTERVEIDGKLITGQNPQSARAVGQALVAQLGQRR
jgi:putative intracellular protease/amidase